MDRLCMVSAMARTSPACACLHLRRKLNKEVAGKLIFPQEEPGPGQRRKLHVRVEPQASRIRYCLLCILGHHLEVYYHPISQQNDESPTRHNGKLQWILSLKIWKPSTTLEKGRHYSRVDKKSRSFLYLLDGEPW